MTAPLKACPFCRGNSKLHTLPSDEFGNEGGDVIECMQCGASSCVEFGRKENLVSRWNTRASSPELLGLVDALREVATRPTLYTDGGELDWLIDDAKKALAAYEATQ